MKKKTSIIRFVLQEKTNFYIILVVFCSIFFSFCFVNINSCKNAGLIFGYPKGKVFDKSILDSVEDLKNSGFSLPILIDNDGGTEGAITWEDATLFEWCSGSGTLNAPYIIKDLEINITGQSSGISILDSDVYFVIRNCTIYNSSDTEAGVKFFNVKNGIIFNNTISDNLGQGISLSNSDYNSIEKNVLNNNKFGIYLVSSSQVNNVINNKVVNNTDDGIVISQSYNNFLFNNTIYNNADRGIQLTKSGNNTISKNTIAQHNTDGIRLSSTSSKNIISRNEISKNGRDGIRLDLGSNNNITGNKLFYNTKVGVRINADTCQNNIIYDNIFTRNNLYNAFDKGNNSIWDYNNLGNYWDDYSGIDEDNDGIGDTPYIIRGTAGSIDNFPIWDDGTQEPFRFCTTIIINEIYAGNPDWIEMYNYGPERDMTGWYLEFYDDNELVLIYNFPNNWIFNRHQVVVLHETASDPDTETDLYTEDNIYWHDRPLAIGLFDDNGVNIDWFQTSTHIGSVPSDVDWEQDVIMIIDQDYANRTHDIDNNKASDWDVSGSGSQGNLNSGQSGEGYPSFHNLVISADPLELGNTEIITIDVYDLMGISQVQIEVDGNIYPMKKIDDFTWQYDSWTPLSTSNKSYTIYSENLLNKTNTFNDSIEVIDTIPPFYDYVYESADPLELGYTEVITISVSDLSGIKQVLLEFESINHSMSYISGNEWRFSSWTPSNPGIYEYIIYFEDNNNNWNSITDSITVVDNAPPSYSDLIESADPLELGSTEIININVYDSTGINQVLIEIEGVNNTMTNIGGDTWQFDDWIPLGIGTYSYTIYMEDIDNNWNSVTESIQVIDTTPPSYSNLVESADPLELGDTEIIRIDILDISGINQVLIEVEELNYTMTNIGGDTWQYDEWTPSSKGTYSYTIYMEDMNNNWESITESITVVDNAPPSYSDLIESADPLELGSTEIVNINVYDSTGINQVLIEIEGVNNTMTNIGGDTWRYDDWTPLGIGTYFYTIYMEDMDSNWNSVTESIQVIDNTPPSYSNLVESADPLELGDTEIISINILDISGINQVLIEVEGVNYTMPNIGGNTWQYDEWTPSSKEIYPYTIYMEDMNNNWESVTESLTVIDTTPPEIIIHSPEPYDTFDIFPPVVDVEFIDYNLEDIWYQLIGISATDNHTWTGLIENSIWDQMGIGLVVIQFYANDSSGNLGSKSIIVEKDYEPPGVIINSPENNEISGYTPPEVDVVFRSGIIHKWYQLIGTITTANYTWTGTITQEVWDEIGNGTVIFIIYANNSLGNVTYDSVKIRKDIIKPQITIIKPNNYDLFGTTPPSVEINIVDPNLDAVLYQITDGSISRNYIWSGSINQSIWALFGTGLVTIQFFANDSVGNFDYASVIVKKDITAPDITINEPNPYDVFGKIIPNVNIDIEDENLESIWYRLFNVTHSITDYSWAGFIEQFIWNEFKSGLLTIRFYANDTLGNIRFLDIIIIKDITPPKLIINEPNPYDLFGAIPPKLDVFILDDNLDDVWYQLSDGFENTVNSTWIGSLSQDIWDELGNGTVKMIFYANDTLSNFATQSVIIRKDIIPPLILVNYPSNYTVFGNIPPSIVITVDEPNFDNMWYQINNGTITTGNYTWEEYIEQSIWDKVGNGTLFITFYSNDTIGNLGSKILIIRKDIIAPKITIEKPNPYNLFGKSPPIINAEFYDPHLSHIWYQLKNGTLNTINNTWTGIIEQSFWNLFGNGTVIIVIYANDSLGNLGIGSFLVHKDVIAPKMIINYPDPYDVFGKSAPDINIVINDNNLNHTWYQLTNGSLTTVNYTWAGILDQSVWDQLGNGTVTIKFYANDLMGNFGTVEITFIKDLSAPIINIINPEEFAIFGQTPPEFKVYISAMDIYNCWYKFLGNKYFFTKSDGITIITINQTKWDEFGNGTIIIEFYVNDSVGNVGFDIIKIRKDIFAPEIKINLPIYEGYWNKPPILNISFSDPNYDTLWYKIGSSKVVLKNDSEQIIDPLIWSNLEQGEFKIYIFANDTAGNINNTYSFTLFKDTIAPLININLPINNTYNNIPPTFNITCFDPNFDSLWYGYGNINISLTNNTNQSLDWEIWNNLPDGIYQLIIYANDTFAHLNDFFILTLYKDTNAPEITIYSPTNNIYYNQPPIFDFYAFDPNLHTLWYEIGEFTRILQNHIGQEIDYSIWNNLPQGEFKVYIFANDSFGYLNNSLTLSLYKDTLAPRIIINLPDNQTYWNSRPTINILVYDSNLDKIWYKIGTTYTWLENNTDSLISDYIWSNLPEGRFTIDVFANDSLGHINNTYSLILYKDTLAPNITINFPYSNSLTGIDAPIFNLSINEMNLDKTWYILVGYPIKYILSEFTGTINQTAWDNFGNGTVIIRFYAVDIMDQIKIKDVEVRKDIYSPIVKVILPINGTIYGSPPIINISVLDPNLESIYYRIGKMNSSLNNNINQQLNDLIWKNIPEGEFYIYFYANDFAGNINNSCYLILSKDTLAPDITINLPVHNQEVGEIAPQYYLTIIEDNLATCWYTLDNGLTNFTFINSIDQIDQELWNKIWKSHSNDDLITIRFYANDTSGHLGFRDVTIMVKKPFRPFQLREFIITGTFGIIFGISVITIRSNKIYKRMEKKQSKKLNAIFYLIFTLISLFLLSYFV
jgi:parallel beta-helix repeat protein